MRHVDIAEMRMRRVSCKNGVKNEFQNSIFLEHKKLTDF